MFVVGNETPCRQKEEVGLVLCFLLISKIQHFSTDNNNCHVLAHSSMHFNAELKLVTSRPISVAKTAYNFKSSAKKFIVTLYSDNTSASSLMYAMNSSGPMPLP